ncbi:hypothetical protein BH160DRAFT_1837 [Burkholderia sp. H160]|nr:hypothetical protein BH160DRAFT_1837 [Burkholderia sp. H160]
MSAPNRHFLIPAKTNTCWEVISGTADDATVRMRVSPQARKKCPALSEFWNARAIRTIDARGRERVLLTSLEDRRRFKPADIVACYERRWQLETSYRGLKQSMLGSELTLRSRTVEGVYQEISGALIASNLIRREIANATRGGETRTDRHQLRPSPPYDPARAHVGRPVRRPTQSCPRAFGACANGSSLFRTKNDPGAHATGSSNPALHVTRYGTLKETLTERHYRRSGVFVTRIQITSSARYSSPQQRTTTLRSRP